MRNYRVVTIAALIAAAMFVMVGCGDEREASSEDVSFLTQTDSWYFYNEKIGENEVMKFRDDFTFYWGCECGEPVGDSDLYELFDYDSESKTLVFYSDFSSESMEAIVMDYSDDTLVLEIDGEEKEFHDKAQ